MSVNISTSFTDANSNDAIQSYFDKLLLVRATYDLIHEVPLMKKSLSQRNGKNMLWRRYEALSLATATLTEGTNPAGRAKTKTDVTATLNMYGDYIEDTDFLLNTQPEAVATENVELLGQQMGETFDQLARDILAGATQVVYANGTSVATVTEVVDKNDLDRAHRLAKNNKAKEYTPTIMASQKIGTMPIMPAYWAFTHEDAAFDIRHVDGFALTSEYANSTGTITGEFGADKNGIRFLSSPNGHKTAGASGTTTAGTNVKNTASYVDVYSIILCGQQAVAGVDLAGSNGGIIRHGFGTSGVYDALNLRQTVGWKKYWVGKILNQNFLLNIRACASL